MKTNIRTLAPVASLLLAVLIAGPLATSCGGGGGGDSTFEPGEVVDALPGGLWEGTLFINGDPVGQDIVAVSTDEGEMRGVNAARAVYFAHANVSGSTFSGHIRVFAEPGMSLPSRPT